MLVEARGLSVRYGNYEALSGVDLDVAAGDFLAVVGPNGSGKSTLVRAILGLVPASSGTVRIGGFPPTEATRRRSIGYLPQKSSYADPRFPATVREVVASGLRRGAAGGKASVQEVLDLLRVADLSELRIGTLSGGQQQRAHLARALVGGPELLILDEPTGALDPESRECFYATLNDINERGVAVLIVSHDLVAVSRAARTVLYLDRVALYSGSLAGFQARAPEHYFGGSVHRHGDAEGRGPAVAKGACRGDS